MSGNKRRDEVLVILTIIYIVVGAAAGWMAAAFILGWPAWLVCLLALAGGVIIAYYVKEGL